MTDDRVLCTFEGITIPKLNHLEARNLKASNTDHDLKFKFDFVIEMGEIRVELHDSPADLNTAFGFVERLVQRIVDIHCYLQGTGCLVVIQRARFPDGATVPFLRNSETVAGLSHISQHSEAALLAQIATGPPELGDALFNLNLALFFKHEAALFSYRAIDTIRSYFSNDWKRMRDCLRINEQFLKELTPYSTAARHATPLAIDGRVRHEILRRAWEVTDRFLMHLLNPTELSAQPELKCSADRVCLNGTKNCVGSESDKSGQQPP